MHYKKVTTEIEYYVIKKMLFDNIFSKASRGPLSFASARGTVVESDPK